MNYVFQRGEDLAVPFAAKGAAASALAGIVASAVLKRAVNGSAAPSPETPAVVTFDIEPRADIAGLGPGWLATAPAAASAALPPGIYVTNLVLTFPGGTVVKSDAVLIRIEAAT